MNGHEAPSGDRICGVCGAKALGYNFNAVTCESCKAFFRRNAVRDEKFQCSFSGCCSIDPITRKFCQRCRLDKCYRIGMRRDWIMSESEKQHKRQRRVRLRPNRQQTADASVSDVCNASVTDAKPADTAAPTTVQPSTANAATNTVSSLEIHGYHSDRRPVESVCSTSTCSCCLDISRVAVAAEFCDTELRSGDNDRDKAPCLSSSGQILNYLEERKLREMVTAFGALTTPLNDDNQFVNLVSSDPSLINLINLCDVAVRRLVKMAKMLSAFCELCQKDQIALLKGGCTELMILCGVSTYDSQNSSWNIPGGNTDYTSIKLSVLKKAPHDVYGAHKEFNETFCDAWKSDVHLMSLLVAVTLFCPSRPHLHHVHAVKVEQESYFYLLRRYLLCTMGGCSGREHYAMAVEKLRQLRQLNEDHIKIFMDVNPCQVEPLLIEVFDLNGAQQALNKTSVAFDASAKTPYSVASTEKSVPKLGISPQSYNNNSTITADNQTTVSEKQAVNIASELIPGYLAKQRHEHSTPQREQSVFLADTARETTCATLSSTASRMPTAALWSLPAQRLLVKREWVDDRERSPNRRASMDLH